MEQPKPATPATAATPGNGPQESGTPSPAAPAAGTPPGPGGQAEGTVTIPTKEFAELQRHKARSLAFEKRKQFTKRNSPSPAPSGEGNNDPELVERLRQEQEATAEAERRAYKAEVTLKVRDLLEKEEYKNLPASTKALILRNPAALSEAEDLDEALLDIEDFVREQVAGLTPPQNQPQTQNQSGSAGNSPSAPGRETPPAVSAGAPAPVTAVELEDVSNLTGVARSRAILRNSLKKARGQVK